MVKNYIKVPVVIESLQLNENNFDEVCDFIGATPMPKINPNYDGSNNHYLGVYIKTLEGEMFASLGDYIIKGVKGEFYPCKPDIFKLTYEEIREPIAETYKDRLVFEQQELADRLEKLRKSIEGENFEKVVTDEKQRLLLIAQSKCMKEYLNILNQRIKTL